MALNKNQKKFIRKKVRILGSKEGVKEFYKRKDLVSEYANRIAKKIYRKERK